MLWGGLERDHILRRDFKPPTYLKPELEFRRVVVVNQKLLALAYSMLFKVTTVFDIGVLREGLRI
jgi:hypothetical protein